MDPRTFPTKGNLMLAKNSLALARQFAAAWPGNFSMPGISRAGFFV